MNHLGLVIRREYLTKVRNKAFIIMTILSPVIFMALFALVGYLSSLNNNKERTISVLDESGLFSQIFEDENNISYTLLTNSSLEEAKSSVEENGNYGLIHIPKRDSIIDIANAIKFYSEDSPSLTLISSLENKLEKELTDERLRRQGVDVAMLSASETKINIAQESFKGQKTSKIDNIVKLAFGGFAGYLLFMFIIIYGNMIMRSVIEEKTSRIIEVIISSVKPFQLMMGKIIGTSFAGITQFIIWVLSASILLSVAVIFFKIDIANIGMTSKVASGALKQMPSMPMEIDASMMLYIKEFVNIAWGSLICFFIIYFVLGYLIYSSIYAAIGAAVDNETDTQQFIFPVIVPLMLAVYVGFFSVFENPHGSVAVGFSLFPLTSPIVMLMRLPGGRWCAAMATYNIYINFN